MHGDGLAVARGVSRYGLRVSEQRARSTAAAEGRSVHPVVAGVPWWGAILIATAATVAGIAIDASSGLRELTHVFAALYLIGCVAAVLAVRQAAIFTAVVQPPLILFIAVPLANYLFHRAEIAGIKDVLINCGYPLIERFPLMLITSLMVLLIGVVRWFLAHTGRPAEAADDWARPFGGITRKVNTLLGRATMTPGRDANTPRAAGRTRPDRPVNGAPNAKRHRGPGMCARRRTMPLAPRRPHGAATPTMPPATATSPALPHRRGGADRKATPAGARHRAGATGSRAIRWIRASVHAGSADTTTSTAVTNRSHSIRHSLRTPVTLFPTSATGVTKAVTTTGNTAARETPWTRPSRCIR
jgi:hypothetical protein